MVAAAVPTTDEIIGVLKDRDAVVRLKAAKLLGDKGADGTLSERPSPD